MSTNKTNVSLQAHYQIEAMCFALQNAARAENKDALPHLVQALAVRIIELNGGLMCLFNGSEIDNDPDFDDLKHAVFGFNTEVVQ